MIYLLNRDLNIFALFECIMMKMVVCRMYNDEDGRAKLTQMYKSYLQCAYDNKCKMSSWRATNNDHMVSM